ncbi:MAG TPA: multicopper oxidase domain-containing protein [Nocardioides sp.]|uniref:multicopper oxidase domain-containing protein n=1 Tax=Nocardioides sp. TaxID=35761 RepID=UPI002F402FFC
MQNHGGLRRRLVGRVTATTAALALAGTAVVLMGQATTSAQGAVDTVAPAAAPASVTVEIVPKGFGWAFDPQNYTLPVGGTLMVQNTTSITHTFTSKASRSDGRPYFDVQVPGNSTVPVPVASTLKDGDYHFYCKIHPVMTGTLTVGAGGPVPDGPQFDQPLTQPPRLTGKKIRIVMKKADVRVLPHGPLTSMWTFGGSFPGPTIVRRAGQDTKVTFVNHLPRQAGAVTIHQHAGHQKSKFDGQPDSFLIRHGKSRTYDYPLKDAGEPLPAALRFYHDHRMDKTARNNWFGLQGLFLTTDPHDAKIGLPHGRYDIPLSVTDRSFTSDNQLTDPYNMTGMSGGPGTETVGDQVLVNGRFLPYKKVRPGLYRLQILNSSLFSSYNFALSDGRSFEQIGTGSGLLPHPVSRKSILLGPAQRTDVVVDFRGKRGKNIVLNSIRRHDAPDGGTGTRQAPLMQFRVRGTPAPKATVPFNLAQIQHYKVPKKVAMTWRFGLNRYGHWTINGKRFNPKRVDHKVRLGSTERWKLVNTTHFTHYIHLHEELWRTLKRDGDKPPPWEQGYEDTWRLDPGETVVVAARFTDYTGNFMIHCHMLDHEDDGMMATFRVVK